MSKFQHTTMASQARYAAHYRRQNELRQRSQARVAVANLRFPIVPVCALIGAISAAVAATTVGGIV